MPTLDSSLPSLFRPGWMPATVATWHRWFCTVGLLLASLASPLATLQAQERGQLVSDSLYFHLDRQQIAAQYARFGLLPAFAPIEYEVDVYRLEYLTPAPTGDSLTMASGLVVRPDGPCFWPLVSYQHGTIFYGQEPTALGYEWSVGLVLGTGGYLTLMPDYLGYGSSPVDIFHPYLHAETEASATVDLVAAAMAWCAEQGIGLSEELFLAGYSQGGHATLAAQRAIEAMPDPPMAVTAATAGSGPYDLSGVMRLHMFSATGSLNSFFLAFTLMAYQRVYGNLWEEVDEAFLPPYDVLIPNYFDRADPRPVALPDTAIDMLQPDYVAAVSQDTTHPAWVAMRDNDLYAWTPAAPLRLYYCEEDRTVPPANTLLAADSFAQRGASQVEAISAGDDLDHEDCALPTLLGSRYWLDGLRDSCRIDSSRLASQVGHAPQPVLLYPQPADQLLYLALPPSWHFRSVSLRVQDGMGRSVLQKTLASAPSLALNVAGLPAGMYWLRIEADHQVYQQPLQIAR